MLGARIDVVEAPIWHFKAYLMPLPDKNRRQLWLNKIKTSGLDRNDRQNAHVCSAHFLSEKVK